MKHIEVEAAIIEKDNKIFCAQRNLLKSMGGKWEFPGGKIEYGETHQQALIREIREMVILHYQNIMLLYG